ncbi:MAG TPA: addiction module protein [Phycisphaerae bacterium]|nr:addiction module protein [Phycisphaerae bacterium]
MTPIGEKLKAQALELPEEDRAELAHVLIESLDGGADEGVEEAWDAELRRRLEEIESGKVQGRRAEDVLGDFRKSGA